MKHKIYLVLNHGNQASTIPYAGKVGVTIHPDFFKDPSVDTGTKLTAGSPIAAGVGGWTGLLGGGAAATLIKVLMS